MAKKTIKSFGLRSNLDVFRLPSKDVPKERIFDGAVFELWTGEYGPSPGGHSKSNAQIYAKELRASGYRARIVPYGGKYFIYFN